MFDWKKNQNIFWYETQGVYLNIVLSIYLSILNYNLILGEILHAKKDLTIS